MTFIIGKINFSKSPSEITSREKRLGKMFTANKNATAIVIKRAALSKSKGKHTLNKTKNPMKPTIKTVIVEISAGDNVFPYTIEISITKTISVIAPGSAFTNTLDKKCPFTIS